TSVVANGSTTSTITITLKDANNNLVSGKAVSLAAASGSSTITTVTGTTGTNGQATFTVKDTVIEAVSYTAKNTTDNITVAQTATVTFTVGAASKLGFGQQPTATTMRQVMSPVKVQVQDSTGNLVTTDNGRSVTVAIGTNPSGGTLSGTTTATTLNRGATFNTLSLHKSGGGDTLTAASTGLTEAT